MYLTYEEVDKGDPRLFEKPSGIAFAEAESGHLMFLMNIARL